MSKEVVETPSENDFVRARQLAEELRRKLPTGDFTIKVQPTVSGEQRYIRFAIDPQIVGRYRGRLITVKKPGSQNA